MPATDRPARRARGVLAAAVISLIAVALIATTVLLPIIGLIAGADASTAGLLDVPVLAIAAGCGAALLVVVIALLLSASRRSAGAAWVWGVVAMAAALAGSLHPLVAVGAASVEQASQIGPFIADLVARFL